MGFPPDFSNISIPEPRYGGIPEINFGDRWRARFIDQQQLPPGVPALFLYAVVLMGDKGYVTRKRGTGPWWTVESEIGPGEKPETALKRATRDQVGAIPGKVALVGYLECRATSLNKDNAPGTLGVRPIYTVSARKVGDVPHESGYERRRIPINELSVTLRRQYEEMDQYLVRALDRYLVMRAKGEL